MSPPSPKSDTSSSVSIRPKRTRCRSMWSWPPHYRTDQPPRNAACSKLCFRGCDWPWAGPMTPEWRLHLLPHPSRCLVARPVLRARFMLVTPRLRWSERQIPPIDCQLVSGCVSVLRHNVFMYVCGWTRLRKWINLAGKLLCKTRYSVTLDIFFDFFFLNIHFRKTYSRCAVLRVVSSVKKSFWFLNWTAKSQKKSVLPASELELLLTVSNCNKTKKKVLLHFK